ncbi:MAG: hypothetical protein JRI26_12315, partial [Deltaproteobacteria bacterium]|nr:hypothetical protein [Deltaproteobacteria bacterium]
AVDDAYYFGHATDLFGEVKINISTAGDGTWTLTWEYWNGTAWTALNVLSDSTSGFTVAGTNSVIFEIPSDWATTEVATITCYWVRARVSSYTSITTQPKGAQAWVLLANYNTIAGPLADAPNAPSSGSEWDIWVRRLSSDISITAQLSPTNDGSYNAPHRLIGWPFRVQHTGYTVDSAPSGTDNLGFDKAKWQFVDSALTEGDNYWVGAEVEFTSGNNNGLKRMVIWFDAASDTVYLDFPLPNDIAASDQYTITLETEEYSNRPQSGIDEGWDSDSKVRPVLNGGGGSFSLFDFNGDYCWELNNLRLTNLASGNYFAINKLHNCKIKNVVVDNVPTLSTYGAKYFDGVVLEKVFCYDFLSTAGYFGILFGYLAGTGWTQLIDCHFQGNASLSTYGLCLGRNAKLKNVTLGRIEPFTVDMYHYSDDQGIFIGENVMLASTTKVSLTSGADDRQLGNGVFISGYNGEPNKFYQYVAAGEVFNVDEDATINPPSGASTYIKFVPDSVCGDELYLDYEEQRYQSSGSKTYTWKIYPTGWSGLSTSDIEIEAWYLDESTGTHRAITTANPSSVTNDSWNDLSITVNPSQAGTVYFTLKLKRYEASAYIALDPEPSVT